MFIKLLNRVSKKRSDLDPLNIELTYTDRALRYWFYIEILLFILKHPHVLYKLTKDLEGSHFLALKCSHLQLETQQMSPCKVRNCRTGQYALLSHAAVDRKREEQRKQIVII